MGVRAVDALADQAGADDRQCVERLLVLGTYFVLMNHLLPTLAYGLPLPLA